MKIIFVTLIGSIINLFLSVIKIITGYFANSQSLIVDGVHSLSDLVTDLAVIFGSIFWTKPADEEHPYGHGRIETFVNIFIGLILAGVGIALAKKSLLSINEKHLIIPGWGAFAVAVLSIVLKESLYRWTIFYGKKMQSRAVVANAWHHRSDALSSIPVAVAVIGSHLYPDMYYLDHIAALIVTAMLLKASWDIVMPCVQELLERQEIIDFEKIIQNLALESPDICEIHKIRSRRIGSAVLLDFHLLVNQDISVKEAHDRAEGFKQKLLNMDSSITDIIIHIEPYNQ